MKHWIKLTAASAVLALGLVTTAPAMIATVEESVPTIGAVVDGFTAEAQTKHRSGSPRSEGRAPWFVVIAAGVLASAIADAATWVYENCSIEDGPQSTYTSAQGVQYTITWKVVDCG